MQLISANRRIDTLPSCGTAKEVDPYLIENMSNLNFKVSGKNYVWFTKIYCDNIEINEG